MKLIPLILLFALLLPSCSYKHWSKASRESVGLATPAEQQKEAIFQIYVARAYSWRGNFGTHPWVAWLRPGDKQYTVAQVTSWNINRAGTAIRIEKDLPDRKWFENTPEVIFTVTGPKAEKIITRAEQLIKAYPYKKIYRVYPGPNSNTFVDYLIRNTPELTVELPPTSIGKDYLDRSAFVDWSPAGPGIQISAWGLLGLTAGVNDGLEVNLLGLTFGVDILRPAIKLPFIGRLGIKDQPQL